MLILIILVLLAISGLHIMACKASCNAVISESIKFLLLMLGVYAISRVYTGAVYLFFQKAVPVAVAAILFGYLYGNWDYYDPIRHRFGISMLGSPNTTAYILSFLTIYALDLADRSRTDLSKLSYYAFVLILASAIVFSQSRGGAVLLFVGLAAYYRFGRKTLLYSFVLAVMFVLFTKPENIQRYDLLQDVLTTGGTGRLVIWSNLFDNAFNSPLCLLVGCGPGSISFYIGESYVQSAHSSFISLLYWFGTLGAILAVIYMFMLIRCALDTGDNLKKSYSLMLLVSFFVDSYLFDANAILLNAALLSFILLHNQGLLPHTAYIRIRL